MRRELQSLGGPVGLFDAFTRRGGGAVRRQFENLFEVVALPGERLDGELREDDLVIQRALGEGGLARLTEVGSLGSPLAPGTRLPFDHLVLRTASRPAYREAFEALSPAVPPGRWCCFLAPSVTPSVSSPLSLWIWNDNSNLVDPASLGVHNKSSETRGIIYTSKAGFLDLGHIRDLCDLTKFVYDQIKALGNSLGAIKTTHGEASLKKMPSTASDKIQVARAISFDDGLGYEIFSYFLFLPGKHNSAFSPEDLCSNFLGTLLAERAIKAGGAFNDTVTGELKKLVTELGGQSIAETRKAFDLINGGWVDFSGPFYWLRNDYLKRRNFEQDPWKARHSSDVATPSWVATRIDEKFSSYYDFVLIESLTKIDFADVLPQIKIAKSHFKKGIAAIKKDAKTRYGVKFDKEED